MGDRRAVAFGLDQRLGDALHRIEAGAIGEVFVSLTPLLEEGQLGIGEHKLLRQIDRLRSDLFGHLLQRRLDRHAGLDADQQQIERVGKGTQNQLLAARDQPVESDARQDVANRRHCQRGGRRGRQRDTALRIERENGKARQRQDERSRGAQEQEQRLRASATEAGHAQTQRQAAVGWALLVPEAAHQPGDQGRAVLAHLGLAARRQLDEPLLPQMRALAGNAAHPRLQPRIGLGGHGEGHDGRKGGKPRQHHRQGFIAHQVHLASFGRIQTSIRAMRLSTRNPAISQTMLKTAMRRPASSVHRVAM